MFLVDITSWWYGNGFIRRISIAKANFRKTLDFFSIQILLKTLFKPYKQISADESSNSINMFFQVFFDKLISRIVGLFARTFMIVMGIIVIIFQSILSCLTIIIWLIIPILPVAGIILAIIGWIPKWIM